MARLAPLILLVLACAVFTAAASAGLIALRIDFRADTGSTPRILTLRCGDRLTGTVPRPSVACRQLRRLGASAFSPTPPQTACAELSGGPSTARITGIYFGRAVWARLRRDNGCEIARWQRVAFLLPPPSVP